MSHVMCQVLGVRCPVIGVSYNYYYYYYNCDKVSEFVCGWSDINKASPSGLWLPLMICVAL